MQLDFALDDFGRLICNLSDGDARATVTASNMPAAASEMLRGLREAAENGRGECWWLEGTGEYRWVIRREGDRATLVVLWSGGTLTGWEHVFWGEEAFDVLAGFIRTGLERLPVHAG